MWFWFFVSFSFFLEKSFKRQDLFFSGSWIHNHWILVQYEKNVRVFFTSEFEWLAQGIWEIKQISCSIFKVVIRYKYIISTLTFLFSDMINDMYILTFSSNGHMYPCGHFGERFFLDSPIYRIFILFYCVVPCF